MSTARYFRLPVGLLLLVASAFEWYVYIGNGVAYGSLVGLAGKETALAELGSRALRAFSLALVCEGFAVGLISWSLMAPDRSMRVRLLITVVVALVLDFATYVLVRGI